MCAVCLTSSLSGVVLSFLVAIISLSSDASSPALFQSRAGGGGGDSLRGPGDLVVVVAGQLVETVDQSTQDRVTKLLSLNSHAAKVGAELASVIRGTVLHVAGDRVQVSSARIGEALINDVAYA
jgi:hypothetical protein